MSRKPVFEAVISTYLETDKKNHDESIEFKISYGFEMSNINAIFKIQMVGGGRIKGRQAPSYSDSDFEKIVKIREILLKEFNSMDKRIRNATIAIPNLTTEKSKFLEEN